MKLNLKNTLIATSIAAGLFGASAFAVAQNGNGTGPNAEMRAQHLAHRADNQGPMMGQQRIERMQQRLAEHQAQLKADLKLAPEQEAAWNAFVARTAPQPRQASAQREDWSKLTTPERLDKMLARQAERSEQMTKRIDATKSFYATLTPEQQKTFDAQAMRGFHRTGMRGGAHHMGEQRHGKGMGMGQPGAQGCDGPMMQRSS